MKIKNTNEKKSIKQVFYPSKHVNFQQWKYRELLPKML